VPAVVELLLHGVKFLRHAFDALLNRSRPRLQILEADSADLVGIDEPLQRSLLRRQCPSEVLMLRLKPTQRAAVFGSSRPLFLETLRVLQDLANRPPNVFIE
jgi:hypothetical protein